MQHRDFGMDRFDVVSPIPPLAAAAATAKAPRAEQLGGRKVGFVWDYVFEGDVMFEAIREQLGAMHDDVVFVDYPIFGNIHGPDEVEVIEKLPEVLRATEVDSVIVGVGA